MLWAFWGAVLYSLIFEHELTGISKLFIILCDLVFRIRVLDSTVIFRTGLTGITLNRKKTLKKYKFYSQNISVTLQRHFHLT